MKKCLYFAFLSLAVTFGSAGMAEVFKVRGPDGKVTYTDNRSNGSSDAQIEVVKIDSYSGPAEVSPVEGSPALRKVTIFTTEWCGVCRKAKSYMASHGIAYDEFDIEKSRSARAKFDRLGGRGVPVILIGKEKMVGFSPADFEAMLDDAGI